MLYRLGASPSLGTVSPSLMLPTDPGSLPSAIPPSTKGSLAVFFLFPISPVLSLGVSSGEALWLH